MATTRGRQQNSGGGEDQDDSVEYAINHAQHIPSHPCFQAYSVFTLCCLPQDTTLRDTTRHSLRAAIINGAAMYNAEDAEGCLRLFLSTAESVLASNMPAPQVSPTHKRGRTARATLYCAPIPVFLYYTLPCIDMPALARMIVASRGYKHVFCICVASYCCAVPA
jgi:hypothetical protein